MPHRSNFLLNRCSDAVLERLRPHLAIVPLVQDVVLAETHSVIHKVYFPHSGIISCVVELVGGGAIETGMIGRDGAFGAIQALDHRVSLNHVVIQVPGEASVVDALHVVEAATAFPDFRKLLVGYDQFFLAHVQQTAACNAVHNVPARFCKWLMRMHELTGDDLPLTHEFVAQMMGVRRTTVTTVAGELQDRGAITYSRGRVRILDIEKLRHEACECNDEIRSHYERVFGPDSVPALRGP